jgi:Uma2 family endonuclease
MTTIERRWTSADLATLPDDNNRYEIIDGELHVSGLPHYVHQLVCTNVCSLLSDFSRETKWGEPVYSLGIIFAEDEEVIPDIAWVSRQRCHKILGADGHFHDAPELTIEVLAYSESELRRDREAKRKLYARRGVTEYWILDWKSQQVEVYRRGASDLKRVTILGASDTLASPLLPGFNCLVREIFEDHLA